MPFIDKTLPWFFAESIPGTGETLTLDAKETQHAAGAKRRKTNDQIIVFDGAGTLACATIQTLEDKRQGLTLSIDAREKVEKPHTIRLASAIPKGDRQPVLLDMVTQLGVTQFIPLLCERSQQQVSASQIKRWHRIVIEACKQSRRAWLPEIQESLTVQQSVASIPNGKDLIVAHPVNSVPVSELRLTQEAVLLVGPEGGFNDDELKLFADAGAAFICLAENVLRTETAAVAMVCAALERVR